MAYDLFEVRVACFVFKSEKMLLLKNKKGTWGILGGHLEKGEQIEETVLREAKEEANLKIRIIGCTGMKNLDRHPSFIIGFACEYVSGEIVLQEEEIDDYEWVELEEIKNFKQTFPELEEEARKALEMIRSKR